MATPDAAILFGDQSGTRVMWLDEFEFLGKAPARRNDPNALDDFQRDYLTWMATAYTTIRREAGGMRVEYNLPFPYIFGALRMVEPNALRNTKGLEIAIQVKTPTTLAVFVEETDGERWSATSRQAARANPNRNACSGASSPLPTTRKAKATAS